MFAASVVVSSSTKHQKHKHYQSKIETSSYLLLPGVSVDVHTSEQMPRHNQTLYLIITVTYASEH